MNPSECPADDTVTPQKALAAAVRHIRREVNHTFDEIEQALEAEEQAEVRLKEPTR